MPHRVTHSVPGQTDGFKLGNTTFAGQLLHEPWQDTLDVTFAIDVTKRRPIVIIGNDIGLGCSLPRDS